MKINRLPHLPTLRPINDFPSQFHRYSDENQIVLNCGFISLKTEVIFSKLEGCRLILQIFELQSLLC